MSATRTLLENGVAPFSHCCDVVRSGDTVWVSGQAAVSPDQRVLAPGEAGEQARIALAAMKDALAAAGAASSHVVKVNNYVTDIEDAPKLDAARREFFGDTLPASVLVEVSRLVVPGLLYEVEAVAVIGQEAQRVIVDNGPPPFSHYCDVVRSGDLVWVSGRSAVGPNHEVLSPGDATEQARVALAALGRALDAVGATAADVVMVKNYVADIEDRAKVNIARQEFFGDTLPASFLCQVPHLGLPGLLYEVEAVAVVGGSKQRVTLEDAPRPFSHYCDVVRSGDLVWVSGQAAVSREHDVLAPGDATEQARLALAALGEALSAVGAKPADVVRVNNYLTNIDDRPRVNVARREFFGETLPASFLCEVPRLVVPGLLYEVDAVAVIGAG